ncbi:RNA methyltransferase [Conexibacter sp. DBS9H8]|uniref:TrmH family RNA methyltransferase n=1 Tax=Conexibacter sp. DBS9H8 TaxID=2937801 RepID=UPI00200DE991|nr:TrmH family RNA methyltransferase [Conexibacter sp. DBS9H8]
MEITEVRHARRDPTLVVLEGFHPIKHALRFGGHLLGAWTADAEEIAALESALAPDIHIPVEVVDRATLTAATPRGQVIAVARRPRQAPPSVLLAGPAHLIGLENPAHLGNLGAVIRVAAAAGAGGVLSTGRHDPWHPDALRGSAGLHFAVPVHRIDSLLSPTEPAGSSTPPPRARVALDPDGTPLDPDTFPERALLVFGTERGGLSDELLAAATHRVALPMAPGVSSMNLATAVAATLYALRLSGRRPAAPERRPGPCHGT